MLSELPPTYPQTRDALHAIAEHVLAAARYRASARIGLRPTPGGFGTPAYGVGRKVARVDGSELVYARAGIEHRRRLTTLGELAAFVDVPLGAPPVYPAVTPADPDRPLPIDEVAAGVLAQWIAFAAGLLEELVKEHDDATELTLWPEHFDLATSFSRTNFGASPGDAAIAEPYLYVGPWDEEHKTGMFAERPWGAALTYADLRAGTDPRATGAEFFGNAAAALATK